MKVWVVVPVYNGAPYLAECLDAVLAQTHGDWRLLVADNASTDGTAEIAAAYAARDDRVSLHRFDEHLSVIRNWNRTFALLPDDAVWCKPALADDRLFPDCLERMLAVAERHPSAGLVAAYALAGSRVCLDVLPPESELVAGRDAVRHHLLGGRYYFGSPNSAMYRADLVRARAPHLFDELADPADPDWVFFQSDTDLCYTLLAESDFAFVHQVLTFTRLHEESISTRWTNAAGTWLPGHLLTHLRHGPAFLDDEELGERVASLLHRYEAFLLRSVARGRPWRDARFRAYQAGALRRIRPLLGGRGIDRALLGALSVTVDGLP